MLHRTWLESTAHARVGASAWLSRCVTSLRNLKGCCTTALSTAAPSLLPCLLTHHSTCVIHYCTCWLSHQLQQLLALAHQTRPQCLSFPIASPWFKCNISVQLVPWRPGGTSNAPAAEGACCPGVSIMRRRLSSWHDEPHPLRTCNAVGAHVGLVYAVAPGFAVWFKLLAPARRVRRQCSLSNGLCYFVERRKPTLAHVLHVVPAEPLGCPILRHFANKARGVSKTTCWECCGRFTGSVDDTR